MQRWIPALAAASVFFFSGPARAHEGYKFDLTAGLKTVQKGREQFSMVYVQGHAHYPDGTLLHVGLKLPNAESYIKILTVRVSKMEFVAELGPFEQHFPPGKYPVVVRFVYEDQTPDMKETLKHHEDMAQCLVDNPDYQAIMKEQNPKRYDEFMKLLRANGGKCIGKDQIGSGFVEIGNPEEAAREREAQEALLRDSAAAGRDLFAALLRVAPPAGGAPAVDAPDPQGWYVRWLDDWSALEEPVRVRKASLICVERPQAFETLNSALLTLRLLQDIVHSEAFGDAAGWKTDLAPLETLGDRATKDERRRRDALRKSLAELHERRLSCERTAAENLADTLFGKDGLEPSREKRLKYLHDLKDDLALEWEIR